jgi:predicted NodU family carbamoyl transferase
LNGIAKSTGQKNLRLAGGVALNYVANCELLRDKVFDGLWIQPAACDGDNDQEAPCFDRAKLGRSTDVS